LARKYVLGKMLTIGSEAPFKVKCCGCSKGRHPSDANSLIDSYTEKPENLTPFATGPTPKTVNLGFTASLVSLFFSNTATSALSKNQRGGLFL
ncbi:hypothetical protein MKX01_041651, partial [Papaver californicum]